MPHRSDGAAEAGEARLRVFAVLRSSFCVTSSLGKSQKEFRASFVCVTFYFKSDFFFAVSFMQKAGVRFSLVEACVHILPMEFALLRFWVEMRPAKTSF